MSVESCEYDGHEQQHTLDSAKEALYGKLLYLNSDLVDSLGITLENCDLNPDELILKMHVDSAVKGLSLSDMTCDDGLIVKLSVQIQVKIHENIRSFQFGTIEDAEIRTIRIDHKTLLLALEELTFTDRAMIVNRASDVMQRDWENKLAAQERFDLMDYFKDSIETFRWNMLHTLVND